LYGTCSSGEALNSANTVLFRSALKTKLRVTCHNLRLELEVVGATGRELLRKTRCMKTNRSLSRGSPRILFRAHVVGLLVLNLQIPIFAQEPETVDSSQRAEAVSADPASGSAETTITDSSAAETVQPVRLDVSDLVEAAPAAAVPANAPNPALYVPPVVAAYLPTVDTNASIGIQYPAGTPEFAYLVAGIRPPGGDPRLPPEIPAEPVVIPAPPAPLVFYERPEIGSKALMIRATVPDQTSTLNQNHTFPPGAFVRGSPVHEAVSQDATSSRPRGAVSYRDAVTTVDGKDVVWNFPPGATLRRVPPPEVAR